ncbi:hypothetical protein RUM44_013749 [Polyplax serrata]|uniref:Uncharacterized protein n=1 Tax=Polyplax serrata TaxID=468196 RepID=A0ABR1BF22_POLSC
MIFNTPSHSIGFIGYHEGRKKSSTLEIHREKKNHNTSIDVPCQTRVDLFDRAPASGTDEGPQRVPGLFPAKEPFFGTISMFLQVSLPERHLGHIYRLHFCHAHAHPVYVPWGLKMAIAPRQLFPLLCNNNNDEDDEKYDDASSMAAPGKERQTTDDF